MLAEEIEVLRQRKIVGILIIALDCLYDLHQHVIHKRARAEAEQVGC